VQPGVLPLCRRIAADLAGDGARAVVLVGSHARGAATPESDVDLLAIGAGPGYQLSCREGRLISLSWRTADQQREQFRWPRSALTEIPGWRSAVIIQDSGGKLYAEAARIAGELLDDQQRSVVAQAVGLAREILDAAR
jgi:Nucleotidyltransferase domain